MKNLRVAFKSKLYIPLIIIVLLLFVVPNFIIIFPSSNDVLGYDVKYSFEYDGDVEAALQEKIGELNEDDDSVDNVINKAHALKSNGNKHELEYFSTRADLKPDEIEKMTDILSEIFDNGTLKINHASSISVGMRVSRLIKNVIGVLISAVLVGVILAIVFNSVGGYAAGIASGVVSLASIVICSLVSTFILRSNLDDVFVAGNLLVVGVSAVNSVVFMRKVKENSAKADKKQSTSDIVNASASEASGKILAFAFVCAIALVVMTVVFYFVFGIQSIISSAVPIIVGILASAFLSIFLGSSLYYSLNKQDIVSTNKPKQVRL